MLKCVVHYIIYIEDYAFLIAGFHIKYIALIK